LLQQILHDDPKPPRKLAPTVPRDLEKICLKAMAKEPRHRYATAGEMAQDLRRFVRGEPVRARPPGWIGRAVRWVRRSPAIAAAVAVAAAALGFTFLVVLDHRSGKDAGLRTVRLDTDPPGATVIFHPLDPVTGEPQPERAVRPAKPTPIEVLLAPGEYLVVAVANTEGYSFHEVYRQVPRPDASFPEAYPHRNWVVRPDGVVELPAIAIPHVSVTEGMARFEGAADFTVGTPAMQEVPPHRRNVPAFWLDTTEVRVRDVQRADILRSLLEYCQERGIDLRPDHAMVFVGYDDAVRYAESVGKRLPTEWEYEYAATRGGTRAFPWGDDARRAAQWTFEEAGQPAWDRLDTDPPVFGLHSNVAEWTSSWPVPYPLHYGIGLRPPKPEGGWRVVRGGPFSVVEGDPRPEECVLGPRQRIAQIRQTYKPGLGFRCARSAKPPLTREDFSRPISE
jgi:formylglycine-generating enzyme required for sulfatase activity